MGGLIPPLSCKDRFSKIGIRNCDRHIFVCLEPPPPLHSLRVDYKRTQNIITLTYLPLVCNIYNIKHFIPSLKHRCLKLFRKSSTTGCHSPSTAYKTLSALANRWEILIRKSGLKETTSKSIYCTQSVHTKDNKNDHRKTKKKLLKHLFANFI